MGTMPIRPVIGDIDQTEADEQARLEPGIEMIPLQIPTQTYKALSDVAARKGMTVAQLISRALTIAIEES